MNLRSPSPDVDGVSDSPYTSSNLITDGQPKVGRGLPSIDEKDKKVNNKSIYKRNQDDDPVRIPGKNWNYWFNVVWLLEKAEKGKQIFGFCLENRYSPYMKGQAFRYAEAQRFLVTDIQNRQSGEFLIISR